jgi:hypothetical protein
MKTKTFRIRNTIIFLTFILLSLSSRSQKNPSSPKNFVEAFAGVEWNTLSGLTGVSYERLLLEKGYWTAGAKFNRSFQYSIGNASLLSDGDGGTAFFNSATGTVHKFFKPNQKGVFLSCALGAGLKHQRYYASEWSMFYVASEFGFGLQFLLRKKMALRWTTSLQFEGQGGITATKLSIAF